MACYLNANFADIHILNGRYLGDSHILFLFLVRVLPCFSVSKVLKKTISEVDIAFYLSTIERLFKCMLMDYIPVPNCIEYYSQRPFYPLSLLVVSDIL